ncbi:ESX secretion-associated protein EspG [Goodfellowiella coeruleoviolacea]|uniref:EspG family protein n=1 Tax=Goodfellowiella coeruleoviolacea TaxID=334858 RepID=A0AAE3GKB4_9PSEU|nr:ESX secretion-associated protein EspG [Goodfellowiella coeruleoviolacea]MCP2169017.1 EspG family protein [Goodfellowiella coeruleoviolacea]
MPDVFECSLAALDVLGAALGLAVRRFPFSFPHHGQTVAERARLVQAVHQDLAGRGLIHGAEFAPEVPRALRVFAQGPVAVAMLGTTGQLRHCALASATERTGVLAVQRGQSVRFELLDPHALVRALVGLLPPLHPGPGGPVTVTAEAGAAGRGAGADEDFSEFSFTSSRRSPWGASAVQRAEAERLLRRPRLGGGYFVVTAGRDQPGGSARAAAGAAQPITLTWLDTDLGRYAVVPETGRDGQPRVTYSPADVGRLAQRLTDAVAAVR